MPSKAEISGGNTLRFNKVTKLAKLGQSLKNAIFGTILAKFLGACFQKWVGQNPVLPGSFGSCGTGYSNLKFIFSS